MPDPMPPSEVADLLVLMADRERDWADDERLALFAAADHLRRGTGAVASELTEQVEAWERAVRVREFLASSNVSSPLLDDARALASFVCTHRCDGAR